MKPNKADYVNACESKQYCALIDMVKERIGISVQRSIIMFPNLFDRWHNDNSDDEGVYWMPRDGNEVLEYHLLLCKNTMIKPKVNQNK